MDLNSALWGVAGILATILFYKLSQKSKKLIYDKKSQLLITNSISRIDGLKVTYMNNPVEDLTNTIIRFKSVGTETISKTDYAERFPLTIETDGEFIIQEDINSILKDNSNEFNNIEFIPIGNSKIQLEIDFLKNKNYFTLNLFHTGEIKVTGELKDGKIICSNSIDKKSISDIFYIIILSLGILFIILLSLVENGMRYFVTQGSNLLFNMILGFSLIEAFFNYRDNHYSENNDK